MPSRSSAQRPQQHHALPPQAELETPRASSPPSLPVDDPGCLGSGSGLNVSATYLTASFGGAPAFYSLWLGQQCTSSVVVHLLFAIDSFRSMKVSSDRICFTPENYREPQLVRIDAMDSHAHSNVISHRTYSLDKNYDRISTPCVIVKIKWCGVGSLLTFGGPMSKRKAATVGSKIMEIDIRKAILAISSASETMAFGAAGDGVGDQSQGQDPSWFVCQLASGHNFSLAVVMRQTSMLFSWGMNVNGELGLSSTTSIADPQLVTALPMQVHGEQIDVVTVSCGKHHAALVTTQAKLFTWGNNKYGQLGHGDFTNRLVPHEVHFALATLSSNQRALRIKHTILERGGTNVTQVACGAFHTLFVTHQQNILAMGYNQAGQLGVGHRLQQHKGWRSCVPIAVDKLRDRSILDIAAGQNHSACVLSNGAVYVWGCGDDGRLGVGQTDCEMTPVLVPSLKECGIKARSVRCGARHTAVISDRDVLFMWGANEFGQLGCGDKKPRYKPSVLSLPVFMVEGVMDVALGEFHSVCITHRGRAFVWGLDLIGESAQIDQRSSPKLVPLPEGQRAQRVSCGWAHTNIVTQSSHDAVVDLMSTSSPSGSNSTKNLNSSPGQGTSFQRTIERKQLVLRRDELMRWKAYSSAWGMPAYSGGGDHENHVGWKSIKKPPSLVPKGNLIPKCSNQSEDAAKDRLQGIEAFVKHTAELAIRNVVQRFAVGKVVRSDALF